MNKITRLVIEDAETAELASELARRTGQSLEEAVKSSLVDRLKTEPGGEGAASIPKEDWSRRIAAVEEISRRFSEALTPEQRAAIWDDDLLYDEHGAPR